MFAFQKGAAVAAMALAVLGIVSIGQADDGDALFSLDLRVRGTGAKEAIVYEPGDVVTLDLFIMHTDRTAIPGMTRSSTSSATSRAAMAG
jgi:hypothetical protein